MSCSNKYDKLVQFINTHYQFHANLGQFALGDRQQYESEAVWRFMCDVKDYIDNLDSGREDSNVIEFPRERPSLVSYGNTAAMDSMDYITFDDDLCLSLDSTITGLEDFDAGAADTVSFINDFGSGQDRISFDVSSDETQ